MEAALPGEAQALSPLEPVLRDRAQGVRADRQRFRITARHAVLIDDDHIVGVEDASVGAEHSEDGAGLACVGLGRQHDGSPADRDTGRVQKHLAFARQDEAEQRLGVRERDWRKRKAKLDAAAAAVILQDFLDQLARERPGV